MANVHRGASLHHVPVRAKSGFQELLEVGVGHAIAFDLQSLFGVAFVIDVIRRVRENQICGAASHKLRDSVSIGCIAHEESVVSKDPKIAGEGNRRFRKFRNRILVR